MKLSEFIVMNESDKISALMCRGVLVAKRKEAPLTRFLFQMDGYYVEFCCDTQQKQVHAFNAFTDVRFLHPFLEQIPLNDIM